MPLIFSMLNTKNLIVTVRQVPSYWAFQFYLNLPLLTGQDLKIKSIWTSEKTPSMCIYINKKYNEYFYKDFSTGKYGNKINLVQELFGLDYSMAVTKLITDYNSYVKSNGSPVINIKAVKKWQIDFIKERSWTTDDAQYWLQYRIGKTMLTKFNVKPLEYYNLIKEEDGTISKLVIEGKRVYGYYNSLDEAYKIYQPTKSKYKFFKIKSHIQGLDQLTYNQPYLVICSSLKDAMCLDGFGYNIEVIAPDSENTMLKSYIIENLKGKYKQIITLFDNDSAGLKAIEKYKKAFNIPGTSLPLSKDLSDSVKDNGFLTVHKQLKPLLKEILNK